MRIAHFIHRYPPALGGAESYFGRLSRWLAGQGDSVSVFTTDALDLEAFWNPRHAARLPAGVETDAGVQVHRFPIRTFPARRYVLKAASLLPWPRLQGLTLPCNPLVPSLWQAAGKETGFDVVHASAFPYALPMECGLRLARRLRVPFFLTPFLHLGDPSSTRDRTRRQYLSPPLRRLLFQADRIFVQTRLEWEAVHAVGIAGEKIILQGLGVEPGECTGGSRRRADEIWLLPADRLRIGHLANLSEEKGSCDLLRALLPLWEEGLPVQVVLAGPKMPNFERFWSTFPEAFRPYVTRLGGLPEERKPDFFAALDVFALPSRSDSFGLVLLEAWANEVPCVGYRAGGVAEVIRHEEDGLLAACGDLVGLADCLRRLLKDEDLRHRWGQSGRHRVISENRWPAKLEIVRREYQRLTQGQEARRASA